MTVLLVKTLDRCGIIDESNNDFSVFRIPAAVNKDIITVHDACIDHRSTVYLQDKRLAARYVLCRYREIALNVLFGENRLSCGNAADNGKRGCLGAQHLEIVITNLDCTRLRRISSNVPALLESGQMRMYRRGGLQMNRFTNLTNRRRIALLHNLIFDIFQNLCLLIGNGSLGHNVSSLSFSSIIKLIPGNGKRFSKICSCSVLTGECVFGIIANIRNEQMFLIGDTGSDGK